MAMSLFVNGETLLRIKGGAHMGYLIPITKLSELGLSKDPVTITPTFHHEEIMTDNFGPYVPAELQWSMSSVLITATLIYFDYNVLNISLIESMAGGAGNNVDFQGALAANGSMMGSRNRIHSSGWHYFSLNLSSPVAEKPMRFLKCHYTERPVITKLGTAVTIAEVSIRALPYKDPYTSGFAPAQSGRTIPWTISEGVNTLYRRSEILSSGAVIWDNEEDTDDEE